MPAPRFTIEQVRSFLAVANHEHVTRAADSLHLSQAAVTQQLRLFERALELRLVERIGRGVRLTPEGRTVAGACAVAVRAVRGIEEAAQAARDAEVGSLHVGASQTAAAHYLTSPLAAFNAAHPSVQLSVEIANTPEICRRVAGGQLDCGLVEGAFSQPGLLDRTIAEDEVILVAHPTHPLAKLSRIGREQLVRHRYLARDEGSGTESIAREILGEAYEAVPKLQLGHLDVVRTAVLGGLGYAVLPSVAVAEDLATGRLRRLASPARRRRIRAVRRPQPAPGLDRFWTELVGRAGPGTAP
jgi:DNA-binding transcriptional LysR family regulator